MPDAAPKLAREVAGAERPSAERARAQLELVTPLPNPPVLHLLWPKWITARAGMRAAERGRGARVAVLGVSGLAFWFAIYALLVRLLGYFKGVEEIGPLLSGKLLGMILMSFSSILLLSNIITALSSFFLARDLDMLVAGPVDWLKLYIAKLLETCVNSSWMVILMAVPLFTAYGVVYHGGPLYPFITLGIFIPFLLLPAVIGSALTLTLVNVFPARRTKDILSVIAVLAAAGIVLLFRLVRPERLARPEGFRSLVDFVATLRTPSSPILPSEWAQRGLMGWLTGDGDLLPLYLLWSTAAAFIVLGALLHRVWYARGFSKAQEGAGRMVRETGAARHPILSLFGVRRRELLLKETRLFFRDTTQWSQLILLAVLVVVYVFNVKYLPLRGEGVSQLLRNVIPFLNLALAGFVLASIAARFIFPGVSLEGRTLWLLRSSPLRTKDLLWSKFWMGTLPLIVLAVGIVGVTDALLQVSEFIFAVSLLTIVLLTFALAGLALGFGAAFPQFATENAAQIPTSFGGLLYMMSAVTTIGGVVVLEARPVIAYVDHLAYGTPMDTVDTALWLGAAGLLCLTATFVPISVAMRRLEALDRG